MENDFNVGFTNNFDSIISTSYSNVQENADETPSSVKTDESNTEVNSSETKVESQQEEVKVEKTENNSVEQQVKEQVEKTDAPKMIPYDEFSLLKELSNSIKEKSGIEMNVSEDLPLDSFIDNLKKSVVDKEFEDPNSSIMQRAKEILLDSKGIDEEILAIATGIPYGIDRTEYMEYITIQEFANQKISPTDFDSLSTLYATYHSLKGISDDDLETYVNQDIERNDESLISKRQNFLKDYADKALSSIDEKIANMQKLRTEYDTNRKKEVNDVISSLLKDGEFTKDEIDAYILGSKNKTEEITLPDGTKKKVTPFEKKKYEFSQKNLKDAMRENIKFFLDKNGEEVVKKEREKTKQVGSLLNKYMEDINSKTSFSVDKNDKKDDDGFTSVKSNL